MQIGRALRNPRFDSKDTSVDNAHIIEEPGMVPAYLGSVIAQGRHLITGLVFYRPGGSFKF